MRAHLKMHIYVHKPLLKLMYNVTERLLDA